MKNYWNESCCLFCASLFTVKVPSRKWFDVNCQTFSLIASLVCTHAIEIERYVFLPLIVNMLFVSINFFRWNIKGFC